MSGVGVSGLLANLPATVTPYPVLDFSLGLGGIRTVADNTARNAVPANFRQEGMLVYSKLTRTIYGLLSDLATWVVVGTLGAGLVGAWAVDSATGNDNNSGLPGSPVATVEEISQRISPNGARCSLQQTTSVTIGAGSYGSLDVYVRWFKGAAPFTHEFLVQGAITSTANILLSAVVVANPGTRTRGELTTLSGAFVAQQRIRVTSGAQVGSLSYSTGLHANAQNTYVGPWLNYATGSTTAPSAGANVVVDTLNTTLINVTVDNEGTGNAHLKDLILSDGVRLDETVEFNSTTGSNQFVDGCQLNGVGVSGNIGGFLWSCRVTISTRVKQGNWKIDGCSVQGNLYAYPNTGVSLDDSGNCFDGGTFILGGASSSNRLGPAVCRVSGSVEFCNGIAASAITVCQGSTFQTGLGLWSGTSAGTAYTTGIQVDPGASVASSVGFGYSINATNAYNVAGDLFAAYTVAPIQNFELQCGLFSTPGGVQSGQLYRSAQSANISSTNLFSTAAQGGQYLLMLTVCCTTADAAASGAPVLTVTWVDDSGTTKTASVTVPLAATGSQNTIVAMQMSHGNTQNATVVVSGIVAAGNARYSVEVTARRMVYSGQ